MVKIKQTISQYIKAKNEFRAFEFLFLLFIADLAFVVIHIFYKLTHNMESSLYCVDWDRGYAEFFQYVKFFWIIILLIYILKSTKCVNYISWVLVFTYFLCDDAYQIHEKIGHFVSMNYNFNSLLHLRDQDIGESISFIFSGVVLLAILIWAYRLGNQIFRRVSADIGIFILAYIFFGGIVDMAHPALGLEGVGLSIFEDAGEMIVVSLILWYVYMLALHKGTFYLDLFGLFRKLITKS